MTYHSIIGLAVSLLVMAVLSSAQPSAQDSSTSTITTADQAVELALEYTGFERDTDGPLTAEDARVEVVTMRDSITPFIADEIDGRRAWLVTLPHVIVDSRYTVPKIAEDNPKDFEVYLDSTTGQLLSIIVRPDGYDSTMHPPPPAREAERQLAQATESYLGIPGEPPKVALADVLDIIKRRPVSLAREVLIRYVWYTREGLKSPRPAWIVFMRGCYVDHPRWPEAPLYFQNSWRYVIDAEHLTHLTTNNIPQPLRPDSTENSE